MMTWHNIEPERWGRMIAAAVKNRDDAYRQWLDDCAWAAKVISEAHADGHTYNRLAAETGISRQVLANIVTRHRPGMKPGMKS